MEEPITQYHHHRHHYHHQQQQQLRKLLRRWQEPAMPLTAVLAVVVVAVMTNSGGFVVEAGATWCVARSNASPQALQLALDYACGSDADCAPIQLNGLCYLPNTMESHSSYAFNSYYQRKSMAPGSCDFAGTAYVAMTDPKDAQIETLGETQVLSAIDCPGYGSCVYPSSPSNAGGGPPAPGTPMTPPLINNPNGLGGGGGGDGGFSPGTLVPETPTTDNDSSASSTRLSLPTLLLSFSFTLLLPVLSLFSYLVALVQ